MLLTIDSGNTNAVFALFERERLVAQWRCSSNARRTADEYAVWLTQLMALKGIKPADVEGCIISNVVPAASRELNRLVSNYFDCSAISVEEAVADYNIPIRISRPEQVGADRLANAVSAHEIYGGALIVVDFGTATTFDMIDPDGGYSGGIIAPGINLSMDALYNAAARLPRIAVEKPEAVIGDDTVSAMQSGVFWGYIGLIEGLVSRIQQEKDQAHTVIGTGGLAPLFHETTDAIHHVNHDLTVIGLRMLYHTYRKARA
ncbi:type III pantothenate kinase [Fodinicurvata sediminis]|uniref:type III pantothenate kinase n=1 Tax=Fodinicurvata sediminis TaxID=1121832 RepID=UPI0003B7B6C5|nr:type III pantothenate kinase [Fodinicurvata sediminis]